MGVQEGLPKIKLTNLWDLKEEISSSAEKIIRLLTESITAGTPTGLKTFAVFVFVSLQANAGDSVSTRPVPSNSPFNTQPTI
jgi:hypothetical protein